MINRWELLISSNFDGVLYVFVEITQRYFGWNDSDHDKIKVNAEITNHNL